MRSDTPPTTITRVAAGRAQEPRVMRLLIGIGAVVALAVVVLFVLLLSERGETANLRTEIDGLKVAFNDSAADGQKLADQVRSLGQTPVVAPAVPGERGTPGAT